MTDPTYGLSPEWLADLASIRGELARMTAAAGWDEAVAVAVALGKLQAQVLIVARQLDDQLDRAAWAGPLTPEQLQSIVAELRRIANESAERPAAGNDQNGAGR